MKERFEERDLFQCPDLLNFSQSTAYVSNASSIQFYDWITDAVHPLHCTGRTRTLLMVNVRCVEHQLDRHHYFQLHTNGPYVLDCSHAEFVVSQSINQSLNAMKTVADPSLGWRRDQKGIRVCKAWIRKVRKLKRTPRQHGITIQVKTPYHISQDLTYAKMYSIAPTQIS